MKFVFLVDFRVHRKSELFTIFLFHRIWDQFSLSKIWGVQGTRKVGIFIYFSQILWGVVLWVTYGRILRKTCQNDFSNQYSFTKGKILIQSNLNDFTFDSHVMSVPKLSILLCFVNYFQSCIRITLKDGLFLPPLFRFLLTLPRKKLVF